MHSDVDKANNNVLIMNHTTVSMCAPYFDCINLTISNVLNSYCGRYWLMVLTNFHNVSLILL